MPAIVSHCLLAEKVLARLKKRFPDQPFHETAFYWGCSGPDLFFCHRMLPILPGRSLHSFGLKMHNMPADEMLNYLVRFAQRHNDEIAMSYALGFVTHYAYDSIAHPFILYFSDLQEYLRPEKSASAWHHQIESALDTILLYHQRHTSICRFRLQATAPIDLKVNYTIARMLQGYLLTVCGHEHSRHQGDDHHTHDALRVDRIVNVHARLRGVVRHEKLLGLPQLLSPVFRRNCPDLSYDPANLRHRTWYDPSSKSESSASFFDLTHQAEQLSLSMISTYLSGSYLTPEQCSASFSGH